MDQPAMPSRSCPACGSADYQFYSRKKITPEPSQVGRQQIETKYRCKACAHEWRVRVAEKPNA